MTFENPITIQTIPEPGNPNMSSPLYRWSTATLPADPPAGLPPMMSEGLYHEQHPEWPDYLFRRAHFQFLQWTSPGDGTAVLEVHAYWNNPYGFGSAGIAVSVYSLGVDGPYTEVGFAGVSPNNGVQSTSEFRVSQGRTYYFMSSTWEKAYLATPEPHDQDHGIVLGYQPDIDPGPIDPETGPVDYGNEADSFTPAANWPATDAKSIPGNTLPDGSGSATILELVREFSAKVRRAVRIVNSDTIRMVDPNEPMPGGLRQADADNMYYTNTQSLKANETVLRKRTGRIELEGSAGVVTNDIRTVVSGWRIPGRLPVYGIDPSPVKRVTLTFTPTEFTASVDFHLPDPPINVRRR